MKKYILTNKSNSKKIGICNTKVEATKLMEETIKKNNKKEESEYLTPFDFVLQEVDIKEPNETIKDFDSACKYLHVCPNSAFTVSQKNMTNLKMHEMLSEFVLNVNPRHMKALSAMNKLYTIAEAWNKEDDFVPDFSDKSQTKWFPWFLFFNDNMGFVYASTINTASFSGETIGSRLCFKTSERARQFAEQFIDLWNDVLLIK